MNAYAVRSKREIFFGSGDEFEPDEYGYIYEVVIAKSRGQARHTITWEYGLTFVEPLEIRLLTTDCPDDLPYGSVLYSSHDSVIPLMVHAAVVWYGMSDIEEWQQWESWRDSFEAAKE